MATRSSRRPIWDISQPLGPELPVWPGDTKFRQADVWSMENGAAVNVSALTMSTHSGTHADAPLHYSPDAPDIAAVGLEPYIGECLVIDARNSGALIRSDDLPGLDGVQRILFRTYGEFPHKRWQSEHTAVSPCAIAMLADAGVRLIGIDGPSLDPQESKSMDAHKAVLKADMRVLEGLVLDHVPPGRYELIALPLPIVGGDASPLRAILRGLA